MDENRNLPVPKIDIMAKTWILISVLSIVSILLAILAIHLPKGNTEFGEIIKLSINFIGILTVPAIPIVLSWWAKEEQKRKEKEQKKKEEQEFMIAYIKEELIPIIKSFDKVIFKIANGDNVYNINKKEFNDCQSNMRCYFQRWREFRELVKSLTSNYDRIITIIDQFFKKIYIISLEDKYYNDKRIIISIVVAIAETTWMLIPCLINNYNNTTVSKMMENRYKDISKFFE